MGPYVIAVVGQSESGKNCLIERLVPLLSRRGLKVGTVRLGVDKPGVNGRSKGGWKGLMAGAEATAYVSPNQFLVFQKREPGQEIARVLEQLPSELDLILLEGFGETEFPQIVVMGRTGKVRGRRRVMATISERPVRRSHNCFRPDQIGELAGLVESEWMREWEDSHFCPP